MASRLTIKHLSNSGQVIASVSCAAGQVSVLRALVDADLLPYQRALSGRPGPERFVIELDGHAFRPEDQALIGFGEHLPGELSVRELLLQAGLVPGSIPSLLLQYGLDGHADSACSRLNESAQRQLQLLAACAGSANVLILNDPFATLSTQWRERFAELVLNDARERQRIVVITSLSHRPQCWIGNESVTRLQVGETQQKTIGFGQASTEVNDLVKQLRSQLAQQPPGGFGASEMVPQRPPQPVPPEPTDQSIPAQASALAFSQLLNNPKRQAALICLLLVAALAYLSISHESEPLLDVAAIPTPLASSAPTPPSSAPSPIPTAVNTPASSVSPTMTASPAPNSSQLDTPALVAKLEPALLIDRYPALVRAALTITPSQKARRTISDDITEGPAVLKPQPRSATAPNNTSSFFDELTQVKSGSSDDSGSSSDSTSQLASNQSVQERQEALRQKFLDAINRAVEARQQK